MTLWGLELSAQFDFIPVLSPSPTNVRCSWRIRSIC